MDNQHRKISGYRELSQAEIDLMNRIKKAGDELLALAEELILTLDAAVKAKLDAALDQAEESAEVGEYNRFCDAEPHRWARIGKTDIQTGVMALVRAVAQPTSC